MFPAKAEIIQKQLKKYSMNAVDLAVVAKSLDK